MGRKRQLPEPRLEIDLHGLSVERALARLRQALYTARVRGETPVLVITGRGWHNRDGQPVLRPRVEAFLRSSDGRDLGVAEVRETARGGALWLRLSPPGMPPGA